MYINSGSGEHIQNLKPDLKYTQYNILKSIQSPNRPIRSDPACGGPRQIRLNIIWTLTRILGGVQVHWDAWGPVLWIFLSEIWVCWEYTDPTWIRPDLQSRQDTVLVSESQRLRAALSTSESRCLSAIWRCNDMLSGRPAGVPLGKITHRTLTGNL